MINHLHQYIGNRIEHENQICHLIEILVTERAMVFVCPNAAPVIHANQHGEAGRHAPQTYTVPMLSSLGNELHPVAKQVFPAEIHSALLDSLLKARAQS